MSQPIMCQVMTITRDRGIPDTALKSHLFTISSECGFCVRDDSQEQPVLRVVNLLDPTKDTQFPMKGDAAILSPEDASICILRVPTMLQAMNLQERKPLGRHVFDQPLNIEHWQWLNRNVLILVSSDAVYTWNYETDEFLLRYKRDASLVSSLQSAKVTSVCFNEEMTWSTLQVVGLDAASSTIQGCFQFQSLQHNVAKVLPGHASTLLSFRLDKQHPKCTVLAYAHKGVGQSQVDVTFVEAGAQKDAQGNPVSGFSKRSAALPLNPSVAAKEFPLLLRASERFGFVNLVTKGGAVAIFDVESTALIFQASLGAAGVFAGAGGNDGNGLVAATVAGEVFRLRIGEDNIVEYVLDRLRREDVAFSLAVRGDLRGGGRLFRAQFEAAFAARDYAKAARLVREAPADTLRNAETLKRFAEATPAQGATGTPGKAPVLVYLQALLEGGGALANAAESVEMARQLAGAGKAAALQQLYEQRLLFACEELGDALLACQQEQLALRVYSEAGAHDKVLLYLITHGKLDGIVAYTQKFPDFHPDYAAVIRKGLVMGSGFSAQGVEALKSFADSVLAREQNAGITGDAQALLSIPAAFAEFGYVKEAVWLLLELCKRGGFAEATAPFQTAALLSALRAAPDLAEALLAKGRLQYFDKPQVSAACEAAGLFQRAFEFADGDAECLRIAAAHARETGKPIFSSPQWFADYCVNCGRFDLEYHRNDAQAAVDAIFNFQQALLDVEAGEPPTRVYAMHVAAAFSRLPVVATSGALIGSCCEVFEAYGLGGSDAQFAFLQAVYPSSTESSVAEQFIRCAMGAAGRGDALVKACRESTALDAEKGFEILTTAPAADEAAAVSGLLTICARFKEARRLVQFLCEACVRREKATSYFQNNAQAIVEQFLSSFAPEAAAEVLEALFEAGVLATAEAGVLDSVFSVDFLSRLLANQAVRDRSDIGLVAEVCLRNQKTTKILRQMLEQRLLAGAIDQVTHTAFAKMLVETRASETEKFLLENPYYDQKGFVRFCVASDKRRRDSFVQTMALKAALVGTFDPHRPEEIKDPICANLLVEVAYGCGMYREFSTVLLKRGSARAWEIALEGDFQPEDAGFFTMNGAKSLQLHREALILATAQNTSVQVESLDERCLAAAMGPFARASDDSRVARCLAELLQRAVLTPGSRHAQNVSIHNLLFIAAAKSLEPKRLKQFVGIQELTPDAIVVAPVLVEVGARHGLEEYFEDAFELYRRAGKIIEAVQVLIKHMTLARAEQFAEAAQSADVWSVLAVAQLEIAAELAGLPGGADEAGEGAEGNWIAAAAAGLDVGGSPGTAAGSLVAKAAVNLGRAKDCAQYQRVIRAVFAYGGKYGNSYAQEAQNCYLELAEYLKIIRTLLFVQGKTAQHVEVDSALLYAYVRLNAEEELEQFLQLVGAAGAGVVPNKGDLAQIGDRAYAEGRYQCAKLLFQRAGAWGRLALALLRLGDHSAAVDAARRANEQPVWRAVNAACLLAGQVGLAKTAGIYLVVDQDELPGVSTFYERNARIAELIELLEAGAEHPQARAYTNKEQNLFTHLGLIYAKYLWYVGGGPETSQRLARFLRSNFERLSVPLVATACRENFLWREVVYLQIAAGEIDAAISEILRHPSGFDAKEVLRVCGRVTQPDLLVQLTEFYIRFHPEQLNEFLRVSRLGYLQQGAAGAANSTALSGKRRDFLSVDPAAVLRLARQYGIELLVRPYLELLIEDDILDVNNQLVDIYIQSNDAEKLVALVKQTVNFDTLKTLDRLTAEAQTPGLRRAAVALYAQLKRFDEGMQYAVRNRFYDEASACADESGDGHRCEQLLRLLCADDFPDAHLRKEVFAVAVARCGARARPDVVIELSWLGGMMDFAMPYLVGQMRALTDRIADMEKKSLAAGAPLGQPGDGFGDFKGTGPADSWGGGW